MKLQLFVVIVLIGCIPMSFFIEIMSDRYETRAIEVRTAELTRRVSQLSDKISNSGYMNGQESVEIVTELRLLAEHYNGRVMLVNSRYKIINDTYLVGTKTSQTSNLYNISEDVIVSMRGSASNSVLKDSIQIVYPIEGVERAEAVETDSAGKTHGNVDNVQNQSNASNVVPSTPSSDTTIQGVIMVTASTKDIQNTMLSVQSKTRIIIVLMVLLVLLFAYWYSNVLTKPFKRVITSIDHITEGSFDEKLSIRGYQEIESMAESFNKMINRINQLESSRQEFVSNVSHELKTPITSIKVLADSLLMQEDVPGELYREFLVDITEEIERENKIINDLLSLVKLDKTAGEMNITSISINDLLEQILKRLKPIAAKRNVELIFESFRSVMAEVDEVKLSLAISNLVENAIKYNFDDGWVRVSLNADHKFFYVKVIDSGVGIPEDVQDHIFERFYRVDKARSRETGGTGLGLSITRNAILMHRGAIKVYSKEKEGTTFTVRVPLNYIA